MIPGGWALLLAFVALVAAIGPALRDWQVRRVAARRDPRSVLDPVAPTPLSDTGAVLAAVLATVLCAGGGWAPLAALLSTYAVLTVGHRNQSNAVGAIGLLLLAAAMVRVSLHWLPRTGFNGVLGVLIGAWLLNWFALFWHQQLHDGRAWTTAGRLVPIAEQLSYVALAAALPLFVLQSGGLHALVLEAELFRAVDAGTSAAPGVAASPAPGVYHGGTRGIGIGGVIVSLIGLSMCLGLFQRLRGPDARLGARRAARVGAYVALALAALPVCLLVHVTTGRTLNPLLLAALVPAFALLARIGRT
ncbi:MAG: hypothetical protein HRU75_04585 [Planctomycetia bacterium]|nr:MAG: hypothetical protein HRU75_04585 [Planctomycetia bacterium]